MKTKLSETILFIAFFVVITESKAQENLNAKPVFGIRISNYADNFYIRGNQMDYWVPRIAPELFIEIKNQDFHLGFVRAHINPGWFGSLGFNSDATGFCFGYRYYPNEILKQLRMFVQIDAARYWVETTHSSLGSGNHNVIETTWSGYFSVGADYRISQRFHAFTGVGMGILSNFQNITENFNPLLFIGFDYRLGSLRKE